MSLSLSSPLPNVISMGAVLSTTIDDLPVKKVLHERHLCPKCKRVSHIIQDINVTDRNGWVYVGFAHGDTLLVTTSRSCDCSSAPTQQQTTS